MLQLFIQCLLLIREFIIRFEEALTVRALRRLASDAVVNHCLPSVRHLLSESALQRFKVFKLGAEFLLGACGPLPGGWLGERSVAVRANDFILANGASGLERRATLALHHLPYEGVVDAVPVSDGLRDA